VDGSGWEVAQAGLVGKPRCWDQQTLSRWDYTGEGQEDIKGGNRKRPPP